jgi:hypothetical protein
LAVAAIVAGPTVPEPPALLSIENGLAEMLRRDLGHRPHRQIGGAAGRPGHDQRHRLDGKILRLRHAADQRHGRSNRAHDDAIKCHHVLPLEPDTFRQPEPRQRHSGVAVYLLSLLLQDECCCPAFSGACVAECRQIR